MYEIDLAMTKVKVRCHIILDFTLFILVRSLEEMKERRLKNPSPVVFFFNGSYVEV